MAVWWRASVSLSSKEKSRQARCAGACATRSQHFTHRQLRSVPGLQHSRRGVSIFIVLRKMKVLELAESAWRREARLLFTQPQVYGLSTCLVWASHPLHPPGTSVPPPFPHWEPLCREHGLGVLRCGNSRPRSPGTKGSSYKFTEWPDKFGRFGKIFRNMLM